MKIGVCKIKAYVNANLGDDLFIYILCNRYPKMKFLICGKKRDKKNYCFQNNLIYISYDNLFFRILLKILRSINNLFRISGKIDLTTDAFVNNFLSRISKYNIHITGSGYVNYENEHDLSFKYIQEKNYFRNKPYIIGCNFGPFYYKEYYNMYQNLFSLASDICFRDKYSYTLFSNLDNVRYEKDIVFAYDMDFEPISIKFDNYVVFSLIDINKDKVVNLEFSEGYRNFIIKMTNYYISKKMNIIFLGFCNNQNDNLVIKDVMDNFKDKSNILAYNYPEINYKQVIYIIKNSKKVLATRYHSMILGILLEKKVCPVCYDEKMEHVLNDIIPDYKYLTIKELKDDINPCKFDENCIEIKSDRIKEFVDSSIKQFKVLDHDLKNYME